MSGSHVIRQSLMCKVSFEIVVYSTLGNPHLIIYTHFLTNKPETIKTISLELEKPQICNFTNKGMPI